MKRRNLFSTSVAFRTLSVGGALLASACATLASPTPQLLAPLDQALSDVSELTAAAEAGDPQAQLAMSIVATHGLHGRAPDLRQGAVWRSQALAHRRVMPVTQYTAASKDQPSRVNIIYVPVSQIPLNQLAVIDRCLNSLRAGADSVGICGDTPESDAARRIAWTNAQR